MNAKWLRALPLLVMFLLAIMLALGMFNRHTLRDEERMVGLRIAPFTLPSLLAGGSFSPQLWKGKVALLNVFASWCVPCASEEPTLMRLAQTGKVPIYGVAWKDTPQNVTAYLQAHGNPYQAVGLDAHGETTIPLALTGVPETFIIDSTGRVYYQYSMPITDDIANKVILPLVEKLDRGDVR